MDRRRVIYILLPVVLLIVGGFVFFFFWNKKPEVKTTGTPSSLPSLLPSGGNTTSRGGGNTTVVIGGGQSTTTTFTTSSIPRLRHLTLVPTSGDIILQKQISVIENRIKVDQNAYYVRYMERATGHIYEIKTDETERVQVTNTTIPKIYEAMFLPDGNTVITRFLAPDNADQILTYTITLRDKKSTVTATSTPSVANQEALAKNQLKELTGIYLEPNISEVALSPSGTRLLSESEAGDTGKFVLSDARGGGAKTVLSHPLKKWLVSLPSESSAVITTKPSGYANGYSYILNLGSGGMRKIIGDIAGLTILPNKDLTTFLGSGTPGNTIKLFSIDDKTGQTNVLPLNTLSEKCIWSRTETSVAYCAVPLYIPNAVYPDDWYKGKIAFTDSLWKIDMKTFETTYIADLPTESGQAIDVVNLTLSTDDNYLTFINKIDLTLWGLDLTVKNS